MKELLRDDRDGDLVKEDITIHVGRFVLQFQHRDELCEFINNLQKISNEIAENHEFIKTRINREKNEQVC